MSSRDAVHTAILAISLFTVASGADAPKFSDFSVHGVFNGKPAEPSFRRGEDQYPNGVGHFRGGVVFDAKRGPNFAGHYTLALWTCGSGCSSAIVVDSVTGRLYRRMPFGSLVLPRLDMGLEPYSFRLDSRLLIVQGYFDIDVPDKNSECSRRYYEWTGTTFKLLLKVPLLCTAQP